jgi:hypothetical protein
MRLTQIDNIQRSDHRFLTESDNCAYLGEFTARQGFNFSETNKQIHNLKIPPSRTNELWYLRNYKNTAINFWGNKLKVAIPGAGLRQATWVPIPCSKLPAHADYDTRLNAVLKVFSKDIDVRNLIRRKEDCGAAHLATDRPTPETLTNVLEVDPTISTKDISEIIIFDDVITRGASFKAGQSILRSALSHVTVKGIFLARTVHLEEQGFIFEFND